MSSLENMKQLQRDVHPKRYSGLAALYEIRAAFLSAKWRLSCNRGLQRTEREALSIEDSLVFEVLLVQRYAFRAFSRSESIIQEANVNQMMRIRRERG